MGDLIVPTNADVNDGVDGAGSIMDEANFEALLARALPRNFVITGWGVTMVGLQAQVAVGSGIIEGHYVQTNEVKTINLPASSEVRVLLTLDRSGGEVTGVSAQWQSDVDKTAAVSADSVCVRRVTTTGSGHSFETDARAFGIGRCRTGLYLGDGASSRTIALGQIPQLVIITGRDRQVMAFSSALGFEDRNFDTHPHTGFCVLVETVDLLLHGEAAWNPANLTYGSPVASTTVTVTGAQTGDLVIPSFHPYGSDTSLAGAFVDLKAAVTATNEVTVVLALSPNDDQDELSHSTSKDYSGTVRVLVVRPGGQQKAQVRIEGGYTNRTYRPVIAPNGFIVGGTSGGQLNASGERYHYLAVI